ncbi:MAG: TonB-dependent receptor family protein [Tannerella sp.]|nr:TonB-dependent receptor family protein [Tannerella sp.]
MIVWIAAQSMSAQITGRVVDRADNTPVSFANVILYNAGDSTAVGFTASDDDGNFSLTCKTTGQYYLTITFTGYKSHKSKPINIEALPHKLPDIFIEEDEQQLSEVVVTGRKRQIIYKLDRQVIEAAQFLSAAGGTAVDILQQTPSVRVDAEGAVTFRGSSGFKVYIDGKPGTLDGAAALEQISATQIDNIEILTTPSAKNEADGAVGIININTKKIKHDGMSGGVNLMGSTAKSRSIDFLLALKRKRFVWQLSGEASLRYVLSDYDQTKTIITPDVRTVDRSTGDRERHVGNYYLRSSFDFLTDNTVWNVAFTGGYRDRWRGGALHYEDTYDTVATGNTATGSFNGKDFVHLYEYQWRGDLGVEHNFQNRKGHKLTSSLYMLKETQAMEHFRTDLWDMNGNQVQGHRAYEYEYRLEGQAKADYVLPLDNETGKFEAGYQLFTYTEDGDYRINIYEPAVGDFVYRNDLYNDYLFRRDIHALYAMYSDTYGLFSYQCGLRGEYIMRKLDNNLKWAVNRYRKFDLFPSIHLSYALNDRSQLRAAYTRRITQPELFYVEPYIVYVDYNTAQQGNPFVLPEYINSVEAGYNITFGANGANSFAATVFHRARRDKIERLRVPYYESITKDSIANVGNDYSTGVELITTLQMSRVWILDFNTSLYDYRIKNRFKVDDDTQSLNWQLAANNNFDFGQNTRLRAEAYYVSPMVSTQGRVNGYFYFNLAARQQLFARRLTIGLTAHDVFATAKYINRRESLNMISHSRIYPRSPLVTVSLSYFFNNIAKKDVKVATDLFEGTNR